MNWAVVPEIFFDLVGRVIPGSFLLLAAFLVSRGPEKGIQELQHHTSSAGFAVVLAFVLLSYFTAVILKQTWCFFESRIRVSSRLDEAQIYCAVRAKGQPARAELPDHRIVLGCIRHTLPEEGLRLLKIQAEGNLCEVMLPGLIALILFDAWLLFSNFDESFGRVGLLLIIAVAWTSFFTWRKTLEKLYLRDLCALWRLLEVAEKDFVLKTEE